MPTDEPVIALMLVLDNGNYKSREDANRVQAAENYSRVVICMIGLNNLGTGGNDNIQY